MIRETFSPHFETLDGIHRCCGCDAPRSGPLAYCDDCEELTESYLYDCHPDQIVHGRAHFTFDAAREMAPVVRHGKGVVA